MNVRRILVPLAVGAVALLVIIGAQNGHATPPAARAQERPTLTPSPPPPPPPPTRRPREDDNDPTATPTPTVTSTPEPPTAEPAPTPEPPTAEPTVQPAQLPRTGAPAATTPLLAGIAGLACLGAGALLTRRWSRRR